MKNILLFLLFPLLTFSQTQIGDKILIDTRHLEMSADGQTIVFSENLSDFVNVKTYKYENSNWINYDQSDISGDNEMEAYRSSISLSQNGNILAVGSPNDKQEEKIGLVRVYEYQNNNWSQIGDDLKTGNIEDGFGASLRGNGTDLSYDGSIIAIGARRYHHLPQRYNGLIKVFKNNAGEWEQMGSDIIGEYTDYSITTGSGVSLSEDGLTLAVGSAKYDYWRGKINVYKFLNNDWVQIDNDIEGEHENDEVGYSLSLSGNGNILALGAPSYPYSNRPGYVKMFEYLNNKWNQIGETIYGEEENERFGYRLTLSSDASILSVCSLSKTYVYKLINNSINKLDIEFDGAPMNLSSDGTTIAIEETITNDTSTETKNVVIYNIEEFTLSNENFDNSSFKLFPNPATEKIQIQLNTKDKLKKVKLFSIQGEVLLSSTESEINTKKLPPGIYVIEIETSKGKFSKKLIIE